MHNRGMIYGYARVSTAAQDETGQVRQLTAAGCEKVFRDKITDTTADRPQLAKLMKALAPGDVVITPAVDRLSRDTTDLLARIIHQARQRGWRTRHKPLESRMIWLVRQSQHGCTEFAARHARRYDDSVLTQSEIRA